MERRAFRVDPRLLEFARELRRDSAPAEQRLWSCLRTRRLNGFKFRRQFAVDRYVADFYCAECKLIVELDGDSHFEPGSELKDAKRTENLEAQGYTVNRFTNVDVFENLEGVLESLLETCEKQRVSPRRPLTPPSPPSTGERE
jgi:very-short-patch-repair endonuclease